MAKNEYVSLLIVAVVGVIAVFSVLQGSFTGYNVDESVVDDSAEEAFVEDSPADSEKVSVMETSPPALVAKPLSFEERLQIVESKISAASQGLVDTETSLSTISGSLAQLSAQEQDLTVKVSSKKSEALAAKDAAMQLRSQAVALIDQLKVTEDADEFASLLEQAKQAVAEFKQARKSFYTSKDEYAALKDEYNFVKSDIDSAVVKEQELQSSIAVTKADLEKLSKQKNALQEVLGLQSELGEELTE
ncbi:hypothetical protein HY486_02930 [Candidatus Woesearchaeota archaeon]|nr:hypothetical protein [Candidatus Woesearchaeota archaeon]